jgi:hypothetical protein
MLDFLFDVVGEFFGDLVLGTLFRVFRPNYKQKETQPKDGLGLV